jgi:hypothetical protein
MKRRVPFQAPPTSGQKTCNRQRKGRRWGLLNNVLREAMKKSLFISLLLLLVAGCEKHE